MPARTALLHYAGPPTVGGVEAVIAHQARGLASHGYSVRIISGGGVTNDERIESFIDPLFGSRHPDVLSVKQALDRGVCSPAFDALVERIRRALSAALADCDVCIAHNVHTLNKNLALTAALIAMQHPRMIAYCHDVAWTNPQYLPELHTGYPWELLRQPQPNTRYVTVSELRRAEMAQVFGLDPQQITVISPGIDPPRFLGWTPLMETLNERLRLLDADGLLLLPARLTRRKNIALGLRVLAALRARTDRDFRLIVTGPPGPHNPTNPGYLAELLALREQLGLTDCAHFLYQLSDPPLLIDDATVSNLYQAADALLFPSVQEGFGIPILEAGLAGIPVFCADIEPLRATGQGDVQYFDPAKTSADDIAAHILAVLDSSGVYRLRVRVRQQFRWDTLIHTRLIPLLELP